MSPRKYDHRRMLESVAELIEVLRGSEEAAKYRKFHGIPRDIQLPQCLLDLQNPQPRKRLSRWLRRSSRLRS